MDSPPDHTFIAIHRALAVLSVVLMLIAGGAAVWFSIVRQLGACHP